MVTAEGKRIIERKDEEEVASVLCAKATPPRGERQLSVARCARSRATRNPWPRPPPNVPTHTPTD